MVITQQIAKHFRAVHTGGNWTDVNLKSVLSDLSWEEAVAKTGDFNTIAALVFHMNYFVAAVLKVLQGGPLDAHDKFSFDCPPIRSQKDWENLVNKAMDDAERFAALVELLPEEKLWEDFIDKKYGTYYTNLHGVIEHTHYHLGQAVLLKKMIRTQTK
jgi:hypothetical protein